MSMTRGDFEYVRELIRSHAAIELDPEKEYLVESRLKPLGRLEGYASLGLFIEHLRSVPISDLHRKVAERMTINETSFFRDARVFDTIRTTVLPNVVTRRAVERSLSVWCAGCSSGQEPYSIAMLLEEHFPELRQWNISVLATDLSRSVLDYARTGRFSQLEVNRGLPAQLLVKYFTQHGTSWEIRPEIRRRVTFREINLIEPWPDLPPMDLVLIRNVLIYFHADVRTRVLERIRRLLTPAGYLVLGGAESAGNPGEGFERDTSGGAACFRPRHNEVLSHS